MGCDIHPVVQVRKGGEWQSLLDLGPCQVFPAREGREEFKYPYLEHRNYDTFAILANVRNGTGFAGIETGEPLPFISHQRGLPEGFVAPIDPEGPYDDGKEPRWMGDHSYTWVTLAELEAYPWQGGRKACGVLTLEAYKAWDKTTPPESYSGGAMGDRRITVSAAHADAGLFQGFEPENVFVKVWWTETYAYSSGSFYQHVLPWLRTLGAPEDVRLVMGFDS